MPTTYGGNRIVPSPLITVNKSYRRLGDTKKVKPIYNITMNGTLLAGKGSPIVPSGMSIDIEFQTSGGIFDYPPDAVGNNVNDGKSMLFLKQNAIRELFSQDRQKLEWIMWNGNQPCWTFPKVQSIDFKEGLWWNRTDYTVTFESEQMFGPSLDASPTEDIATVDSGNMMDGYDFVSQYNLEDASDTISIEMQEDYGIFKVNRSLSAKGYRSMDTVGNVSGQAYENARAWVLDRVGYDPSFIQSSVFNITSAQFSSYNHFRTQNTDLHNGSFSCQESWVLASGNYYEDYSAEIKQTVQDPYQTVTCQGTVNGLTDFVVGTSSWAPTGALIKYNNASGAFFASVQPNIYVRAQNYIGIQLNPIPLDSTVTHNFNKGIISYGFSYNSRPLNLVSGTISEVLNINDSNIDGAAQVIASHTILNRDRGPIFQDINTTPETSRSISYECVLSGVQYPSGNDIVYLMSLNPRTQVLSLFSGLAPTNYYPGYRFLVQDDESFSPLALRYSLNRKYLYERL